MNEAPVSVTRSVTAEVPPPKRLSPVIVPTRIRRLWTIQSTAPTRMTPPPSFAAPTLATPIAMVLPSGQSGGGAPGQRVDSRLGHASPGLTGTAPTETEGAGPGESGLNPLAPRGVSQGPGDRARAPSRGQRWPRASTLSRGVR